MDIPNCMFMHQHFQNDALFTVQKNLCLYRQHPTTTVLWSKVIRGMHIVGERWGGTVIGYQWINILRMFNRHWCQRKVEADICVKGIVSKARMEAS